MYILKVYHTGVAPDHGARPQTEHMPSTALTSELLLKPAGSLPCAASASLSWKASSQASRPSRTATAASSSSLAGPRAASGTHNRSELIVGVAPTECKCHSVVKASSQASSLSCSATHAAAPAWPAPELHQAPTTVRAHGDPQSCIKHTQASELRVGLRPMGCMWLAVL